MDYGRWWLIFYMEGNDILSVVSSLREDRVGFSCASEICPGFLLTLSMQKEISGLKHWAHLMKSGIKDIILPPHTTFTSSDKTVFIPHPPRQEPVDCHQRCLAFWYFQLNVALKLLCGTSVSLCICSGLSSGLSWSQYSARRIWFQPRKIIHSCDFTK